MKKIGILSLCAIMGLGAMAQETVLKEAEKAAKGKNFEEVVTILTPAFSDPTTSKMAQTYYIPGKMALRLYDDLLGEQAIAGSLSEEKTAQIPTLVVSGFDYLLKALPLDTVVEVDKKGNEKIKTKYSKDIVNSLVGHYNDLNRAGSEAFNRQDYEKARRAWELYTTMPTNPIFAKGVKDLVPADTVIGEISFYQGFAAFRMDQYADALAAFQNAIKHGYKTKDVYDYAIYMAQQAEDEPAMFELCSQANAIWGATEPNYLGQIINTCIQKKDFESAIKYINEAIAQNPDNSQLYVIKGVIFENFEGQGDPIEAYKQAIALDPENAMGQSYYGRMLVDKASAIYDAAPGEGPEFVRILNEEVKPLLNLAVPALEKAYQLNDEDIDALRKLEAAYYLLNDDTNLQRVQNLIKIGK